MTKPSWTSYFWPEPPQAQQASDLNYSAPVPDRSIWFPLSGPPRTKEEADRLHEAIEQEKQAAQRELAQSSSRSTEIKQTVEDAAKSNCADLELEWRQCLKSWSSDRFLTMCRTKKEAIDECMAMQTV
ncbi:hypothetical protein HDV03_004220 [Kappamyces sp. JEL0829]|nr:hypothetical protein HDV03_004220 [Kappamyces sp. JEL0829]